MAKAKQAINILQCPFISEGDPFSVRKLRGNLFAQFGGRRIFFCAQDDLAELRNAIVANNWGMGGNFVVLIRPSADQVQVVLDLYHSGRISASCVAIEYSGTYLDRRMAMFKEANKVNRFVEHKYLRAGQDISGLRSHIVSLAKEHGLMFSPEASRYFQNNFPTMIVDVRSTSGKKHPTEVYDFQTAASEIEKLLPMIGNDKITDEMLETYCTLESGKGIYTFIRSVIAGDMPKTYAIAERDFFGNRDSAISTVLRALRSSLYSSYLCKLLSEKHGSQNTTLIASELSNNKYRGRFSDWAESAVADESEESTKSRLESMQPWLVDITLAGCASRKSGDLLRSFLAVNSAIIDSTAGLDIDLVFRRAIATCFNYDVYHKPFSTAPV